MFLRKKQKSSGDALPGMLEVCPTCAHYKTRMDNGHFCYKDGIPIKLTFVEDWKYFCGYFELDTSKVDRARQEHKAATQDLRETVAEFNRTVLEPGNIIPISNAC